MRALLPVALALLASTQCGGATVEEVAERALPSIVAIVTYDATGAGSILGTGFFVSPRKIITNHHVVDGAYSAEVYSDQGYYDRVTILCADNDMDLAMLSVDGEDESFLDVNPDAELKPGQRVIVIGNPLGLARTVSDGLISGVHTVDEVQHVQITAPVSPGSSGSPVLDEQGRVIGVVFGAITEGQNLNFAVGIETLMEFLALKRSPRELEVAGSSVVWRVVVKWIVTVVVIVAALALGGGWVIVMAVLGIVRLWRVFCWLWKLTYRLLTRPFRRRGHLGGLPTGQVPHPGAVPSDQLPHPAGPATAERGDRDGLTTAEPPDPGGLSTGQRRDPADLPTGEGRPWSSREPRYVGVKRGLIAGAVLLIGAAWLLSASVDSATDASNPAESAAAQIEPAPTTETQTVIVYITRTGSKYHRAGCRYLRKSKIPIPLKEAKQHYEPCSVCNPPR